MWQIISANFSLGGDNLHRLIKILTLFCTMLSVFLFSCIIAVNIFVPENINVVDKNPYTEIEIFGIKLLSFDSNKQVTKIQNKDSFNNKSQVKLLNIIPVKTTIINNTKRRYVITGGECFGIKIYTDGVILVSMDDVETVEGVKSPAKEAGLKTGDIIKKIDGVYINSNSHLSKILQSSDGKEMTITIERQGIEQIIKFKTFKEKSTGKYRAGIWVRDSTAGLGTISFYNPENSSFAGLGHGVYDIDTGDILPLRIGEVCPVIINDIYKSNQGNIGEMCGVLDSKVIGSLYINCERGVYGFIMCPQKEKIPVATKFEVKTGKAQIACSLNNSVEYYDIEIKKIYSKSPSENKDMIIKITDDRLIDKTGGIVQGMSGSPIIQNGMFVGALTHVFVNNPRQGYAIIAEKMLETSTCQEMKKYEQIEKAS